jgi:hypothetical protein
MKHRDHEIKMPAQGNGALAPRLQLRSVRYGFDVIANLDFSVAGDSCGD